MTNSTRFRNTAPLRALSSEQPPEENPLGDLLGGDAPDSGPAAPALDGLLGGEPLDAASASSAPTSPAVPPVEPLEPAPASIDTSNPLGFVPLKDASGELPLVPMSLEVAIEVADEDDDGPQLLEIEGDPLGPAALAPEPAPEPAIEIECEPEPQPESVEARRLASLTRLLNRAREDQAALEKQLSTARTERDRALRELELRTAGVAAAEAAVERARAETGAIRGHLEGKLEQARRDGPEALIHEMIPVVDYLDMALRAATPGDPFVQGVELTRKAMIDALARFDAVAVGAEGEPFDPRLHDAAVAEIRAELTVATVIELLRRGWTRGGKTLRPAMVKVGRPPEPSDG